MPQQVRGSATHPDATKLVMTARKSIIDSQQRFGKPRNWRHQQATTHQLRALPTHRDTVRNSTTPKQARRARVHLPERNRKQRPASSTKQRNPTRCQQRDASAGTTRWRWSAATHQDGTKSPQGIDKAKAAITPAATHQKATPQKRCAAPADQMEGREMYQVTKTHWTMALPAIKLRGSTASLTVRPPLRSDHGTTLPVAGNQTQ